MSHGHDYESEVEREIRIKNEEIELEKVKNNPEYYLWRELREKYKEFENYIWLNKKWSNYNIIKPKEVEVTAQMIEDFKKQKGSFHCSGQPFTDEMIKKALVIANGDFDKATEWL